VLVDGTVACWGADYRGARGGSGPTGETPGQVPGIATAVALGGSDRTFCALLASGTVTCWGANDNGQAGDGTRVDRWTPATVVGIDDAVAVDVRDHGCVLLAAGSVRCWGANWYGQLGDGTIVDHLEPVTVEGITADALVVDAATRVRLLDGTVRGWGPGGGGWLGNGSSPLATRPTRVAWPTSQPLRLAIELAPRTGTLTVPLILTPSVGDKHVAGWLLAELPRSAQSWPAWEAEKPASFTFKAGDADRTLYGYVLDDRGSISPVAVASTELDTAPPGSTATLPAVTRTQVVPMTVGGHDAGSGVAAWLASEIRLVPRADDPRWRTTAPTSVTVSPGDGVKPVYVWTRDWANNVSVPAVATTRLDTRPPKGGGAPVVAIRRASVTSSAMPVRLAWDAAVDESPGALRYELGVLAPGVAAWAPVALGDPRARTKDIVVRPGTWRFRVRALDVAGNPGPWRTAASVSLKHVSDGSSTISYTGSFSRRAVSGALGGYVRATASRGATASVRVTARGLAFVSTRSRSRGIAEIWLDGERVATVDLYASTLQPARVVWSRRWNSLETHRVRIVVTGRRNPASSSSRVDVDAFLVLR
jgi:hypothetical protein